MWRLLILWLCCCVNALDSNENVHYVALNPGANAVMGAVMQVHDRGIGLFGCGAPSRDGVVRMEAMRWMVDRLNQEWEGSTFLPNISIGVQVYDSCGRSRVAASHLGELLPMLRGDDVADTGSDAAQHKLQLGLVDGASLLADAEVRETLEHFQVPVVTLESDLTLVSADLRAKALVALTRKLNWQQVVVIHDEDYYSLQMLNTLTRYFPDDGSVFLTDVRSLTPRHEINTPEYVGDSTVALDTVLAAKRSETPVVVLAHPYSVPLFVEALQQRLNTSEADDSLGNLFRKKNLRLLFSSLLSHQDVDSFPDDVDVFSLTTLPIRIPDFEEFWIERIRVLENASKPLAQEDKWFFDYISSEAHCSAEDVNCKEDSLEVATRTQHVISAGQAVLSLAQALKQAWNVKCSNATCSTEVVENDADDDDALLIPHSDRGWLKKPHGSLSMQLVKYETNLTDGSVFLEQVEAMLVKHDDILALEPNFQTPSITALEAPSSAPAVDTLDSNPRSREELGRRIDSSSHQLLAEQDKYQYVAVPPETDKEYRVLVPSRDNLYVAALFAVHKETHGDSLLRCSGDENDLDLAVVRQLEAFLWALKRVNSKNNLELGAILLDTCSSRLRTMTLTAGLDSQHVLAAINALPAADASVAEEIMSAINITSVSTGHSLTLTGSGVPLSPYILQVEAPMAAMVQSIISVLQHLGWSYVSVVYSDRDENLAGFKLFQAAAAQADVCLALQEAVADTDEEQSAALMSALVPRLVGARADGARGVVLWTTAEHTRRLMRSVSHAVALGTLSREDLFWLLASTDGKGQATMRSFGNVLGGALVFRPQHRPIREFQHHLQQVHSNAKDPSSNNNPWLKKYYEECEDIECLFTLETSYPRDMNAVQAVYAVGAAVTQARNQLCSNATSSHPIDGLCSGRYSRVELQRVLNTRLRQSATERADGAVNENFRFTETGSGNVPTEILNFRRKSKERGRSLKNIHFERVGTWNEGKLVRGLSPILAYRDSDSEVPASSLSSQCRGGVHCCGGSTSRADRVTLEPARQAHALYIAATFAVHTASANPLECGVEVNREGVEQLEAFLWTIDQVNLNNSHLNLGAIALDSCGSVVKMSRAVTDLLSTDAANIVALISSDELSRPLSDVVDHLRVATFAPSHRKPRPPYPLQLGPSVTVQANAIVGMMRELGRKCFAVVYQQDGGEFEDMFRIVEEQIDSSDDMKLTAIAVPASTTNITDILAASLNQPHLRHGLTAVVLLLPQDRMELVLRTVHTLSDQGQLDANHFTWIAFNSEELMQEHSALTMGSLSLRPQTGRVVEFENFFRHLSLVNNTRNPWFTEFWSSVFHCRGATCHSQLYPDLQSYQQKHNYAVVNTINSVLSVTHALESVRRDLCPESSSGSIEMCASAQNVARVRQRLFEVAPRMAFVGAGLNAIAFSSAGENSNAGIEVLNQQPSGHRSVGYVDPAGKATLNHTEIKSYLLKNHTEVQMRDVSSFCIGDKFTKDTLYLMEIPSNGHISLLSVLAGSGTGLTMFDCGKLLPNTELHLAAMRHVLEQINSNTSLLPGVQLGLTVLDTCSRSTTAHNAVYTYLASTDAVGQLISADIAAAVNLDEQSADSVAPLLTAHNITQLVVPVNSSKQSSAHLLNQKGLTMSNAAEDIILKAIVSVIHSLNSRSYSIVRSSEFGPLADELRKQTLLDRVCLSGIHVMTAESETSHDSVSDDLISMLSPGTLVVVLLDNPEQARSFLTVCQSFHSLVILMVGHTKDISVNSGINTILTLYPSHEIDKQISEMASVFSKTLTIEHANTFKQSYKSSSSLVTNQSRQSLAVIERIMSSFWTVARGLHNFFDRHCEERFDTLSVNRCRLKNGTRKTSDILEEEIFRVLPSLAYEVWNGNEERVGSWTQSSGLQIFTKLPKFISDCNSLDCTPCAHKRRPALSRAQQYSFAAILGGLCLLGAFLTILTTIYFLAAAALPNNNKTGGTSVLGYFILFGLMLLFTADLSFVIEPTEVTCGVRRFLPGVAYAIVFAGMLLKVRTSWRYGSQLGHRPRNALGRPAGLLVASIALVLVQILLAGSWLALVPPVAHSISVLRCYPTGHFETHLLLSLTYVAALLTATAVFALMCHISSKKMSEEWSGEARWILIACVAVAVVLSAWGISTVTFLSPGRHADLATALTHLIAAYALLLCLYVPKVCLYSRLKANKKATQNNLRQVYDITHFQPPTLKMLPHFATPSLGHDMMEVDDEADDELHDDPTQIVPSSLYSLSMFSSVDDDDCDEEGAGHCEPGTNEFTPAIQTTNPLLLLGLEPEALEESISYM